MTLYWPTDSCKQGALQNEMNYLSPVLSYRTRSICSWNAPPDSKVYGANMGPTWADRPQVAPGGPRESCYLVPLRGAKQLEAPNAPGSCFYIIEFSPNFNLTSILTQYFLLIIKFSFAQSFWSDSDIVVLCAEFQNDLVIKMDAMDERDFASFEFTSNSGGISYMPTVLWDAFAAFSHFITGTPNDQQDILINLPLNCSFSSLRRHHYVALRDEFADQRSCLILHQVLLRIQSIAHTVSFCELFQIYRWVDVSIFTSHEVSEIII